MAICCHIRVLCTFSSACLAPLHLLLRLFGSIEFNILIGITRQTGSNKTKKMQESILYSAYVSYMEYIAIILWEVGFLFAPCEHTRILSFGSTVQVVFADKTSCSYHVYTLVNILGTSNKHTNNICWGDKKVRNRMRNTTHIQKLSDDDINTHTHTKQQ